MNTFFDSVGSSISNALEALRGGSKAELQLNLEDVDEGDEAWRPLESEATPKPSVQSTPKSTQDTKSKCQSTSWADLMEDDDEWALPQTTSVKVDAKPLETPLAAAPAQAPEPPRKWAEVVRPTSAARSPPCAPMEVLRTKAVPDMPKARAKDPPTPARPPQPVSYAAALRGRNEPRSVEVVDAIVEKEAPVPNVEANIATEGISTVVTGEVLCADKPKLKRSFLDTTVSWAEKLMGRTHLVPMAKEEVDGPVEATPESGEERPGCMGVENTNPDLVSAPSADSLPEVNPVKSKISAVTKGWTWAEKVRGQKDLHLEIESTQQQQAESAVSEALIVDELSTDTTENKDATPTPPTVQGWTPVKGEQKHNRTPKRPAQRSAEKDGLCQHRGHKEVSHAEVCKLVHTPPVAPRVTPSKSVAFSQPSVIQGGVSWAARVRGTPASEAAATQADASEGQTSAGCGAEPPEQQEKQQRPQHVEQQPEPNRLESVSDHSGSQPGDIASERPRSSVSEDASSDVSPVEDSPSEEPPEPRPLLVHSLVKTPNAWRQGPPPRFRRQPTPEPPKEPVHSPESVDCGTPGYTPQWSSPDDERPSRLCWADRFRGETTPSTSHPLLAKARSGRHITFQGHQFPPAGWIPSPYISKKPASALSPAPYCHPRAACGSPADGQPVRLEFSDAEEVVLIDPAEAAVWVGSLKIRVNTDKWLCEHFGPYSLTRVLERGDGYAILQFPRRIVGRVMEVFQGYRVDGRKMVLRPSRKYIPAPEVS